MDSKAYRSGPSPHTKPRKTTKGAKQQTGMTHPEGSGDVKDVSKDSPNTSRRGSVESGHADGSRPGSGHSHADDVTKNAVNHSDNVTPDAGDNDDDVSSQNADDVEAEMASPELSDERDVTQEHVTSRGSSRASSRAMSLYEHVDPQDFDARSFFSSVSDLSSRLQSASLTSLDTDFDADEMQSVVSAVSVTMQNFRLYSEHSQQQLERLRTQLHDTKERMHRKIALAPYDPRTGESGLVAIDS